MDIGVSAIVIRRFSSYIDAFYDRRHRILWAISAPDDYDPALTDLTELSAK